MPCIAATFNPNVGPILQIAFLPPQPGAPPVAPAQPVNLNPNMYSALLDTGASSTCNSPKVAADLGLQPIPVSGVHGAVPTNVYQFVVGFWLPQTQHPSGQIVEQIHQMPVDGPEFDNTGCGFDVLLGRDIICQR